MTSAPYWTPETKRFIFVACAILVGLAVWRFSIVLSPLIVAIIIAYLLNPATNWFSRKTRVSRKTAAVIVYITFLFVLILIPALLTPLLIQQIRELDINLQGLRTQFAIDSVLDSLKIDRTLINLESLTQPVTGSLDQVFSPVASIAANVVVGIAGGFIWAIFIFVVGFYVLLDANRFSDWVDSWIPTDHFQEFSQLQRVLDGVWKSYFVGQLIMATIVGLTVGLTAAMLGIRSAILLGLIAALLELIPNWGYGLSGTIGVIFAYFQGSSWIPLPNWAFALLVAGLYFLMWQIDTNYLLPRIIGNRLQLSPAIVIIGIIAGASVGGALGLLLAAPIIATIRVLGSYIYRRLLDLEPYVLTPEPAVAAAARAKAERKKPPAQLPSPDDQEL